MKYLITAFTLLMLATPTIQAASPSDTTFAIPAASYLLPGAPTFDLSISEFREKFNTNYPTLRINEFRAVKAIADKTHLTRAASKINENLYASAALERVTLKIKSIQITWLPIKGPDQKAARAKAMEYMAALMHSFTPSFTRQQCIDKLNRLLSDSKHKRYFAQNDGAIRYIMADNGEKGLTFAIEPIKLTLSETMSSNE